MTGVQEIQDAIIKSFGFFPPFFAPALKNPIVLKNLWEQTQLSYVNNPIPELFKEKLAAILSLSCHVPYCFVCHSCSLRPLGLKTAEILQLIETDFNAQSFDMNAALLTFRNFEGSVGEWPSEAELEDVILKISILISNGDRRASVFHSEMKRLLGESNFDFLVLFISYIKMNLIWAESHADGLNHHNDKRALENLYVLINEEPRLAEYFLNHRKWLNPQANL